MITLTIEGKERQYPKGTTYEEIVKEYQPAYDNQIAVVAFNGKIRELFKRAVRSGRTVLPGEGRNDGRTTLHCCFFVFVFNIHTLLFWPR